MKVLSEKPVLPQEVKDFLEKIAKDTDLSFIEEKTINYLKTIPLIDYENAKKLYEELKSLNYPELSQTVLIKIVEFLPETIDDLKVILYGITLEKEKAEKIQEIVKKYK